jgi:tripartite-type tricarboxylate transporter receptor subunit TctC
VKAACWVAVLAAASASCLHAAASAASEATFPIRPLRWVVPYAPGGGGDILARSIAAKLTEAWGQPVIIDNRPGGGTIIGTDLVAKAPRDGHTILLATNTHAINPSLHSKLPYDSIRDFAPVTILATSPNVLLTNPAAVPARTVSELIAFAKARPGKLNYGSSGNGGTGHLAMEMLKSMTGISVVHVPYNGGGPAMKSLLGGEVSVMFNNILASVPQIKAGRVGALGVTGRSRSAALPDVPTVAEAGVPGFEATAWFCIFAPAGTPAPIVKKINAEAARILRLPDIKERLVSQGLEPVGNSPEEFSQFLRAELVKWSKVIKDAGIVAD